MDVVQWEGPSTKTLDNRLMKRIWKMTLRKMAAAGMVTLTFAVAEQLPEEYKKVIEVYYLKREYCERVESWKIAKRFHIAESSLYRIRKKAIKLFSELYPW